MTERKYQVFISSTYDDLQEERRAIIEVILSMGHIPAGMEQFSAGNRQQWDLIKERIDECDYYIVVIAQRYGSFIAEEDDISYTWKEYEYARETGKSVAGFILDAEVAEAWPQNKCQPEMDAKLGAFKDRVMELPVDFWKDANDLKAQCVVALGKLFRSFPQAGWISGKGALTPEISAELARLSAENSSLRDQLEDSKGSDRVAKSWDVLRRTEGQDGDRGRRSAIEYLHSEFEDLAGLSVAGAKLTGLKLHGANLEGADFSDCDLRGADLEGCSLSDAKFTGADLTEARLCGAIGEGVDFGGARLQQTDLTGASLPSANFGEAQILQVTCEEAKLPRSVFDRAVLQGGGITSSDLSNCRFEDATFADFSVGLSQCEGVILPKADLSGLYLTDVDLRNVALRHLDLKGARLRDADLRGHDLHELDLAGARLGSARLDGVDLSGADLTGADLESCSLTNVNLDHAKLDEADLRYADLKGLDLTSLRLRGAKLSSAELEGACLRGVDLSGADLDWAKLSGTDLRSAILTGASVRAVSDLDDCLLEGAKVEGLSVNGHAYPSVDTSHRRYSPAEQSAWMELHRRTQQPSSESSTPS